MMIKTLISLALLYILFIAFLVAPVSAGLSVTDGVKIISPYGATSPVITVTDSDIPAGGTITIDVTNMYYLMYSGVFTDSNVVITSDAAAATWTHTVSGTGDTITLTSADGNTTVGENITVTFTGAGGNPWLPGTTEIFGDYLLPLTITRTDTFESATINFMIETPTPPTGGLTVSDGAKITTPDGVTSAVITIADADISAGDTITIKVPDLFLFVRSGSFTDANIIIDDTADVATWSGVVSGQAGLDQIITLSSTGGNTTVGETITVTFTGARGNPWYPDTSSLFGDMILPLTVTRIDTFQTAFFTFLIETIPPMGGLTVTDGAKITTALGATSPVISIADTNLPEGSTITIDVSGLTIYAANGTFTDANIVINDTAVNATWTGSIAGDPLTLTMTSTGGNTTVDETVNVTFTGAEDNPWVTNTYGEQTVLLTVVRTDTGQKRTLNFVIETIPPSGFIAVANFSATPIADIAPLTVSYTDTSLGNVTTWNWDFGDGSEENATVQHPVHTYTDVGTYTVNLTATNAYGSDTKTWWDYIHVLNGGIRQANTTIDGLTITNCGGPQTITVDTSVLRAALIPNNSVLEIHPPVDRGLKSIIVFALNGVGFARNGNLISGNPTGVYLVTDELAPTSGFSGAIGSNASLNFSIALPSYPCNAQLITKIWEGVIPAYDNNFRKTVDGNNASVVGTAYTATIKKSNFPPRSNVRIHMSVDSNWNTYPNLPGAPGMIFIWRISDNETHGQIFPTHYLYTDPVHNLDYYEADSPNGLSTFGLSSLTGNNNPFQMITLILTEIINPPDNLPSSDSTNTYVTGAVGTQNITSSMTPMPVPRDPGKTAKIYSNAQGIVTQATTLQSTDGFASVNIGTGVVAIDGEGKPLSSITIKAIPSENLPNPSPEASLSFAGRAYELQPDGASFSPGILINFTLPSVQFGQEFIVKMFDHASGTWQDVSSSYNPETGTITAHVSHFCCFALFAETVAPETISVSSTPAPVVPKASTPAPTAMSTFMGMIMWIADLIQKNIVFFVGVIILAIGIFLYGRKRRRDRLMYLF